VGLVPYGEAIDVPRGWTLQAAPLMAAKPNCGRIHLPLKGLTG